MTSSAALPEIEGAVCIRRGHSGPLAIGGACHSLRWSVLATEEVVMHEGFQSCIQACYACAVACEHCASACIAEGSRELGDCIRLDLDCGALCRLAAEVMSRGGPTARQVCRLCAEVCDACAQECEKHPLDHCRECAKACRACARECRAMAS